MRKISCQVDQFSVLLKVRDFEAYSVESWQSVVSNFVLSVIFALQLDHLEQVNSVSVKGYDVVKSYGLGVSIAFHSCLPRQGILIQFSARGLRDFEERFGMNVCQVLKKLGKLDWIDMVRLSRLDFAIDFIDIPEADVDFLYREVKDGKVALVNGNGSVNHSKTSVVIDGDKVETFYVGSRTSNFFFRIYNKKNEQLENKQPSFYDLAKECLCWTRYEAELKHKLIHALTAKIISVESSEELNKLLLSVVLSRIRFIEKGNKDFFVTRKIREMCSGKVFSDVIHCSSRNQSLSKSRDWFFSEFSGLPGLMYKILSLEGEAKLDEFLQELKGFVLDDYEPSRSVIDWLKLNNK